MCTQNFLRCLKPSPHSVLFPHQTWTEFFPPGKKCKGNFILSFHSSFLYQNPCSSHFHLHFFLLQLWKVPPSTSKTSSINTPHSSRGELLSPHLLSCFTTKNPYGFMMGCKEPKTRPKMSPQHFPKPIWSLWARAM